MILIYVFNYMSHEMLLRLELDIINVNYKKGINKKTNLL